MKQVDCILNDLLAMINWENNALLVLLDLKSMPHDATDDVILSFN